MKKETTGGSTTALRATLLLVVPAGLFGVAIAHALAAPANVLSEAPVRVLADGAGAIVLGLAVLPRLHERLSARWQLLTAVAGLWAALEFVLQCCEAAQVAGVSVLRLPPATLGSYLVHITGGQVGIAIFIGTGAVTTYCAVACRRPDRATPDLVLVFTAVTLVLRPVTGHMSQQTLGSVLAALHVLAASGWFGTLAALALVLRGRREWAMALPRFSGWALPAVAVVGVSGVIDGLVHIDGFTPLFTTGYGRILLGKAVLLTGLIGLGWWWRRSWVPQASDHRLTAESSLRRAIIEVTVMAVVFGLAATLAVTG